MLAIVLALARRSKQSGRVQHRRVWVEKWQMECCGDAFKIGAEVEWATWPLVDREWFVAILGDAEAARFTDVEDHHDEVNSTPENLYFATDELDAVYERAITVGSHQVTPIETHPWGERSFYCLDLDGNRLCFVDDSTLFLGRGADWS